MLHHRRSAFCGAVVGMCSIAGQADADCFEYRADSFAEPTIVRGVAQGTTEARLSKSLDGVALRESVWLGATDYLIVQMASSDLAPSIYIEKRMPRGFEVRAQSWSIDPPAGTPPARYAEVHYSGSDAHRNGDGWFDVVFSSEDGTARGGFSAWIVRVNAMPKPPAGYCDAAFIPAQGTAACDVCARPMPPDGDFCPPGTTDFNGVCM